jgi:hypoxanthine phosphoribosyltransferase
LKTKGNNSGNVSLGDVLLDSSTIQRRVRELGAQIAEDYIGKNPLLLGVLKGASIFHADLVRAIPLELSCDFIAVNSYGDAISSSGEVRILNNLEQSLEEKNVLLVEDIVDTGLTLHYLIQNLQTRKPESLKIVTLLNKPARRRVDVPLDYIGFDVPDMFLVGYGLDYAERYRNINDIRSIMIAR